MAYRKFEMYHFGKQISWEGYVIRVNLNEDDPLSMRYHSVQIMVKMEPEDHKNEHGPDIGLTFSELNLERNSEAIEILKIGDKIKFNATLISLGDKHHIHHLRAFHLEKIDGHKDVWSQANGKGRYKLKIAHLEADKLEKEA